MTFKHTNFEDSETMRSLVKLAKEKGLVKEDPLQKIASKKSKLDLKPTESLSENLMKLCGGLRASGMKKYAEELESAFLMYKQAAASECDNDLVQDAHPKGSPLLEGVAGDAVIETIIDEHLAMMKVVNKMPTGKLTNAKLTNAKSIINAVKISLGEDDKITQLLANIRTLVTQAGNMMKQFAEKANKDLTLQHVGSSLEDLISNTLNNPTLDALETFNSEIDDAISIAKPGWSGMGAEKSTWTVISALGNGAKSRIDKAIEYRRIVDQEEQKKILAPYDNPQETEYEGSGKTETLEEVNIVGSPEFSELRDKIRILMGKLNSWKAVVNTYDDQSDVAVGSEYITNAISSLQRINSAMDNVDPEYAEGVVARLTSNFTAIETDANDFYKDWIA